MKTTPTFRPMLTALLALTMSVLQTACQTAEKGDVGPAGVAGAQGPKGDAGAQGPVGSANVSQITFSTAFTPSVSGKTLSLPASIDKATVDKSMVLVYIQTANNPAFWYQVPGLVSTDDFRYIVSTSTTGAQSVIVVRSTGTFVTAVNVVRILLIPAATLANGRLADVDYSNYNEVKRFYNLPD